MSLVLVSAATAGEGRRYGKAFIERFSLTSEQVAKLEHIKSFRVTSREQERVLRHQINEVVHSDTYDEQKLAKLADQLTALIRSNLLADAGLTHEFYLTLNEKQRQSWVSHETRETENRKPFHKDGVKREPSTQRPDQQP